MDPYVEEIAKEEEGFDVFVLLRIFWRRKWLFFVPFILCLAVAGVAIKVLTPIYYSDVLVRVIYEAPTASVLPRESRYGRRHPDRDALYNIETIVTGRNFLERVAQELFNQHPEVALKSRDGSGNPGPGSSDRVLTPNRLARQMRRWVRVKQVKQHLFAISVRDTDAERAYVLTQLILERFLEEERANRVRPSTATRNFLEEQRQDQFDNLALAEAELADFERSMLSESLAGNPINELNLNQAESSLNRLRARYFDADTAELFTLEGVTRSVLGELPNVAGFTQDADIATVMREMAAREFDDLFGLSRGAGLYTSGGLRLRLNSAIETKVARDFPRLGVMDRNKISQYLYHRLYRDVRHSVMTRLEQNIQEFRQFMTRQPEQSSALSRLRQDVDRAREHLATIERDITQENLRIEASLSEIGYKMVVHQDPYLPTSPIEPNQMKLAFMGFVLALAIGGGLVVLIELLDRSYKTVRQIELSLGLPVIGTMPVIDTDFFRRQRQRRAWIWMLLAVGVLVIASVGLLFIYPRLS